MSTVLKLSEAPVGKGFLEEFKVALDDAAESVGRTKGHPALSFDKAFGSNWGRSYRRWFASHTRIDVTDKQFSVALGEILAGRISSDRIQRLKQLFSEYRHRVARDRNSKRGARHMSLAQAIERVERLADSQGLRVTDLRDPDQFEEFVGIAVHDTRMRDKAGRAVSCALAIGRVVASNSVLDLDDQRRSFYLAIVGYQGAYAAYQGENQDALEINIGFLERAQSVSPDRTFVWLGHVGKSYRPLDVDEGDPRSTHAMHAWNTFHATSVPSRYDDRLVYVSGLLHNAVEPFVRAGAALDFRLPLDEREPSLGEVLAELHYKNAESGIIEGAALSCATHARALLNSGKIDAAVRAVETGDAYLSPPRGMTLARAVLEEIIGLIELSAGSGQISHMRARQWFEKARASYHNLGNRARAARVEGFLTRLAAA